MNKNLIIIGIAGGTASGKSAIAKYLLNYFSHNNCAIIQVDSYYHDLANIPMYEREKNNFDHPDSIDFDFLFMHLMNLKNQEKISVPVYDYKTHTRTKKYTIIKSQKLIILEGLFALYDKRIKNMLNIKVFVDTHESIRLKRRIKRDLRKRDRDYHSIIKQFNLMVSPMHNKYVEPTKLFADSIITSGVKNNIAIEQLISKIISMQNNINISK